MKDSEKKKMTRAGFTLVELVVVIVILGILAGVAYPAYTGYIKKANDTKVQAELNEILLAAEASCAELGIDMTGNTTKGGEDNGPMCLYIHNSDRAVRLKCFASPVADATDHLNGNDDTTSAIEINGASVTNKDVQKLMEAYGDGLFKKDGTKDDRTIALLDTAAFPTICGGLKNTSYVKADGTPTRFFAWSSLTGWYTEETIPELPEEYAFSDEIQKWYIVNKGPKTWLPDQA